TWRQRHIIDVRVTDEYVVFKTRQITHGILRTESWLGRKCCRPLDAATRSTLCRLPGPTNRLRIPAALAGERNSTISRIQFVVEAGRGVVAVVAVVVAPGGQQKAPTANGWEVNQRPGKIIGGRVKLSSRNPRKRRWLRGVQRSESIDRTIPPSTLKDFVKEWWTHKANNMKLCLAQIPSDAKGSTFLRDLVPSGSLNRLPEDTWGRFRRGVCKVGAHRRLNTR